MRWNIVIFSFKHLQATRYKAAMSRSFNSASVVLAGVVCILQLDRKIQDAPDIEEIMKT
jgi:hypothetical protein